MVEYAEETDDPDAWKFIAAILDRYVKRDQVPPMPLLRGISDALKRWRGGERIAVVFGEDRPGLKGTRPAGLVDRHRQRTNARLMAYFLTKTQGNESKAAEKVAEQRANMDPSGNSESVGTIKKHYKQYLKN